MKSLLFPFLILITLTSVCQEKLIIKIGKNSLGALYSAIGAHMYSDNQWESAQNKIPNNLNIIFQNSNHKNYTSIDNFISFQIRPININGRNNFIFINKYIDEKLTGIDPNNSINITYTIFDSLKFTKHITINLDTIIVIETKSNFQSQINRINKDSIYIKNIENDISKKFSSSNNNYWKPLFCFKLHKKTAQVQFMKYTEATIEKPFSIDSCFYHTNIVQFKNLFGFNSEFINLLSIPEIDNLTEIYTIVDELPEFPGGNKEMWKYINKTLKYPKVAIYSRLDGLCHLRFIINTDGMISNIKVIQEIYGCPECSIEAVRDIYSMPKWKPAKVNGTPVNMYYNLKIYFNLYSKRRP